MDGNWFERTEGDIRGESDEELISGPCSISFYFFFSCSQPASF